MTRGVWFIIGIILVLGGGDLLARGWLGPAGWLVVGVGVGIGAAVLGSLVHDALAGPRERLR